MPGNKNAKKKFATIAHNFGMMDVVNSVANFHHQNISTTLQVIKGPQKENEARKVTMHLCQ